MSAAVVVNIASEAWAVVVAGLGGAGVAFAGSFLLEGRRERSRRKARERESLVEACKHLVLGAVVVSNRAVNMQNAAQFRSGVGEGVDVTFGHRKPVDPLELGELLLDGYREMFEAQVAIWTSGDEPLISQAAKAVHAAGDVLGASRAQAAPIEGHGAVATRVLTGVQKLRKLQLDPAIEEERDTAVRALGDECRRFATLVRHRLGTPDMDAVLRALPVCETRDDAAPASGPNRPAAG